MSNKELEKINSLTQLITDTAERHIGLVIEQSDRDIGKLMNTFQSLLSRLQESESHSSKDVTDILEALQFHDRTSQILSSVQSSIKLYREAINDLANDKDIDLEQLEAELKKSFVVAEQYSENDVDDQHIDKDKPLFF